MVATWGAWPRKSRIECSSEVSFEQEYHPAFLGEYAEAKASRNRLLGLTVFSADWNLAVVAVRLSIDAYGAADFLDAAIRTGGRHCRSISRVAASSRLVR